MKMSKTTVAAMVGTFVTIAAMATPANANCTKSTWIKTSGDSLADTIKGRDCGGVMSAKFTGPAGSTGWLEMNHSGETDLVANFDDGNITTRAIMQTMGTLMTVKFKHQDQSGLKSNTYGTYMLKKFN